MTSFRLKLGIYLLFLAVYLLTGAGHFISVNHVVIYRTTQALVERGSLAHTEHLEDTVQGRDGRYYAVSGLAQPLLSMPLYAVGKLVDTLASPDLRRYFVGRPRGVFGGEVAVFFVALFNQLVTPLTCLVLFLLCLRLGIPRGPAFATTLAFGLGTAAWAYAHDYFTHPLETLFLLLAVSALVGHHERLSVRHAALGGAAFAAALFTRVNLLVLAPSLALYVIWASQTPIELPSVAAARIVSSTAAPTTGRGLRSAARPSLAFWLPALVALAVEGALNAARFGSPWAVNPLAQAQGFGTPLWFGLYGNLFSLGRSVFLYSPPLLLALAGWPTFWRRQRAAAVLFLAVVVSLLVFYSLYLDWDGGWAWGPRFLVATLPLLILPLGYLLTNAWRMTLLVVAVGLGAVVQLLGIAVNYNDIYPDWFKMKLEPEKAFLFVPDISPIPTHWTALLEGRHVDLRLLEVYQDFGLAALLATVAVPLALLAVALVLLRQGWQATGETTAPR